MPSTDRAVWLARLLVLSASPDGEKVAADILLECGEDVWTRRVRHDRLMPLRVMCPVCRGFSWSLPMPPPCYRCGGAGSVAFQRPVRIVGADYPGPVTDVLLSERWWQDVDQIVASFRRMGHTLHQSAGIVANARAAYASYAEALGTDPTTAARFAAIALRKQERRRKGKAKPNPMLDAQRGRVRRRDRWGGRQLGGKQ